MSGIDYKFNINVEKQDEDDTTLNVDSFTFLTRDGNYLTVSCSDWDGWELEDGEISGSWSGLEFELEDPEGNTLIEYHSDDEALKRLLEGAELKAYFFDEDGLEENGYDKDYDLIATDVHIIVAFEDKSFEFTSDELMTEQELYKERGVI